MGFGSLFWWNFWTVLSVIIVVGIVVALTLFIRWGRRKSTKSDAIGVAKGDK